jgi:D-alanine-D-alanine ligase
LNIVVLAGGLSPERDVSLVSGGLIARALAERGHKVLMLDVYEGIKLEGKPVAGLFTGKPDCDYKVSQTVPDLEEIKRRNKGRCELIGEGVMEVCRAADVVFIALHGGMGENGQLQATFDNFNIKYTGSGYIGSLLAMDKDISKRMLKLGGIPTPGWILYDVKNDRPEKIINEVGLPCVVKPDSCGSSVGVSMVEERSELDAALSFAARYERYLIVERKISGREFSVGVLNGRVLPAIEIIPKSGFYDYKNKYQSGLTEEICPARLTETEVGKLERYTLGVFSNLRLYGYARIDFILDRDGEFWCLEANTLPGMTPMSLLPQEAAAAGISYGELCEMIALQGLERKKKSE